MEQKGVEVEIREIRGGGHVSPGMAKEAASEKPKAIIAAGGDGTINGIINGMAYSGVPLGTLPLGTANVLAQEIKLPNNPQKIADVLTGEKTEMVHMGKMDDHYFCCMAGIGFDAGVCSRIKSHVKRKFGRLAYLLAGFELFISNDHITPELTFTCTSRDDPITGYHAVIGNTRYYGGKFKVTPEASLTDPALDICVFKGNGRLNLFRYALSVALGRHVNASDTLHAKTVDISIKGPEKVPVQVDGDFVGYLPKRFTIAENAIELLIP
jgi:YegS/Rv2252/BmrU family lipid kinase